MTILTHCLFHFLCTGVDGLHLVEHSMACPSNFLFTAPQSEVPQLCQRGKRTSFGSHTHTRRHPFDPITFVAKAKCDAEHSHFQVSNGTSSFVTDFVGRLVDASQESEAPVAEECWKPSLGKWLDSCWEVERRSLKGTLLIVCIEHHPSGQLAYDCLEQHPEKNPFPHLSSSFNSPNCRRTKPTK